MSTMPQPKDTTADLQREALSDSEKKAAEQQPGSYKDRENDDKRVEVLPIDVDSMPMQGLDPDR